ncbi:flagellar hook-associated protein FlgL [Geodermatophilus sp. URMC 61]|uniref:flagellar hook-associated protein FlgL n=1 Tax=Geodermatophilus sp. URMC 61 TaxID=3423411 RepID=UPI00406C889B
MRITHRAVTQTALLGLNTNLSSVAKLQRQLTSGKLISTPSDSPTGANTAMQVRQDQRAALQYARNITDGQGWLDETDSKLQSIVEHVHKVRALTVQGMNTGAMSAASREAIGVEVAQLREAMLGLANAGINGRPLFGGPTTGSAAYDAATGGYTGVGGADDVPVQKIMRRVSDSEEIRIDITGPEAFGTPGDTDLFAVVDRIARNVVGDPDELSADLTALDGALDRLLDVTAAVGARAARMDASAQLNADLQLTLTGQLEAVEDIDLAKTIMDLSQAEVGYKAALQATAKVIQPTLVDFLA